MVIEIQSVDPSTGFELCVFPQESRRKRASWIMWISPDGSAALYTDRSESGAVIGDPIKLPPNASRSAVLNSPALFRDDPKVKQLGKAK